MGPGDVLDGRVEDELARRLDVGERIFLGSVPLQGRREDDDGRDSPRRR